MELAPCPACARHLDVRSRACVFCGAPTPELRARRPGRRAGLTRAAMVALGATLAAAGCGDPEPAVLYGGPPTEEPEPSADIYGGPPVPEEDDEPEPEEESEAAGSEGASDEGASDEGAPTEG